MRHFFGGPADCDETIIKTQDLGTTEQEGAISFRLSLPANPNFFVTYLPMTGFFEFLTYVSSCLGTWLGVSMLDLNFAPLIAKLVQRGRQRRGNPWGQKKSLVPKGTNNFFVRQLDFYFIINQLRQEIDDLKVTLKVKGQRR